METHSVNYYDIEGVFLALFFDFCSFFFLEVLIFFFQTVLLFGVKALIMKI
jgi:hypothetical protein